MKMLSVYFSRDMSQIVENGVSHSVEESFRKILIFGFRGGLLLNCNLFFLVQRFVNDKIFTKIRSVILEI